MHLFDNRINELISDVIKDRVVNIADIFHLIKSLFKLLDNIDTASDMFKPKYDSPLLNAVGLLQDMRWLHVSLEGESEKVIIKL